jgi:uncharacterized Zn-binding protein involved in type VI secretion
MNIYASQTYYGKDEEFSLQVARGLIPGHSVVTVFGYNPDVDTSEESVWPNGGTVPHPTVASVLKISSTDAADASPSGTGARSVLITGINANYDQVSETVVLSGQTAVNTVNSYLYVNGLTVTSVGSGGANAGDINVGTGTVTAGVPAVLYDMIAIGYNNRTTGHYCVPAGYTGYLVHGLFTAGQASGSTAITGKLLVHSPNDNIVRVGAITTLNNGVVQYMFNYPTAIPEKNCVGATAIGSANNNSVSSMFNICLVKNYQE